MKKRAVPVLGLIATLLFLPAGNVLSAQTPPVQAQQAPLENEPSVLSQVQLESLLSPIALYPDPLLSQVLVASTYPLEIIEAAQWLRRNPSLTGPAAQSAASGQNWDPSVQALVMFPDVLFRMSDDVRWTIDLGNAFLAQQSAMMDAVQHLRSEAMASGKLSSGPETTVTTEAQGNSSVVEILPANPEVIYVPDYDPALIWGAELYPYPYMPDFDRPFGYPYGFMGYGPGIFVGSFFAGWGGWGAWGWRPNWFGHNVIVNNGFFSRYGYNRFGGVGGFHQGFSVWGHNPVHRGNVPYANRALAAQFRSLPRGGTARRSQMSPLASPLAVAGFARPASPALGSSRSFAGNRFSSGASRQFAAAGASGYFTPNRTAPVTNFHGAAATNFRSSRSYSSAPVMRGGGQLFGRAGGGGGFSGRASGGGRSSGSWGAHGGSGWSGGHSSGGRSGGGRGGRR